MTEFKFPVSDATVIKLAVIRWAQRFDTFCCLNSNDYKVTDSQLDFILAAGKTDDILFSSTDSLDPFSVLTDFCLRSDFPVFGHFGYDLKNSIEELSSSNVDQIRLPDLYFFKPQYIVQLSGNAIHITTSSLTDATTILNEINTCISSAPIVKPVLDNKEVRSSFTEKAYIETVRAIQKHIQRGDIFEINLCQEFYIEDCFIDPSTLYLWLNEFSPSPFSCFYRIGEKYLLSSSPERYLKKTGNRIISQPIKGTARRGKTVAEDELIKQTLATDSKEMNENVMIVDLVRNDLSRLALPGTVHVDELFGIYTFEHVHQMISTISAQLPPVTTAADAIKNTFPMGSMTGAPKVKAMELIETYETFKRGLYSGSIGYISPNGDFDLNVVIRSFLYNTSSGYLSYPAGSAITAISDPVTEYNECLLKAKPIFLLSTQS